VRCKRRSPPAATANDAERALFALVCNRAIAPDSKLAAAEWATNDAAIPGLRALEAQHAYRAMDVLASALPQGVAAFEIAVFAMKATLAGNP
jgi:hypothetical protein